MNAIELFPVTLPDHLAMPIKGKTVGPRKRSAVPAPQIEAVAQHIAKEERGEHSGVSEAKPVNSPSLRLITINLTFVASIVAIAVWFLIGQTMPLYETMGFPSPSGTAWGAVFIMLGFATLHGSSPSWRTATLCALIGIYEAAFVAIATHSDDRQTTIQQQSEILNVKWLREKVAQSRAEYEATKHRYEDVNSKVYQNAWFAKTSVTPTWERYSNAQADLSHALQKVNAPESLIASVTLLKIAYRLALVFLLMSFVHRLVKVATKFAKSNLAS